MNYLNLLKIMKYFESICKYEVFWDFKYKLCMYYIVNDNLLRYVKDV